LFYDCLTQINIKGSLIFFSRLKKKKTMHKLTFLGAFGLATMLLLVSSCYKIENTTATITVTDKNGKVLPGTSVHIFPNPTQPANPPAELNQTLDVTVVADSEGKVYMDYTSYYQLGQVGLFVLNIEATSGDSIMIPGIIKVEEQKDNYETIKFPFEI
jgi:hypothetical protein